MRAPGRSTQVPDARLLARLRRNAIFVPARSFCTAGGYGAGDPTDPIPNSEVKTRCADGTAGATRWESTAPPANLQSPRPPRSATIEGGRGLFVFLRDPVRDQLSRAHRSCCGRPRGNRAEE